MWYKKAITFFLLFFSIQNALCMNDNTKIFLCVEGKKFLISRDGLKKSELLNERIEDTEEEVKSAEPALVEVQKDGDFVFNRTRNELCLFFDRYEFPKKFTKKMVELYAKLCSEQMEFKKLSKNQLLDQVFMAFFLKNDAILEGCAEELTMKISSDDFVNFLSEKGLIWSIFQELPKPFHLTLQKHLFPTEVTTIRGCTRFNRGTPLPLSFDGKILCKSDGGNIVAVELKTGKQETLAEKPLQSKFSSAYFLKGGGIAASFYGADSNLIKTFKGKKEKVIGKGNEREDLYIFEVRQDGAIVYYIFDRVAREFKICLYTGKQTVCNQMRPYSENASIIGVFPNGNIFQTSEASLDLISKDNKEILATLDIGDGRLQDVCMSPNGDIFALVERSNIFMWDASTLLNPKQKTLKPTRSFEIERVARKNLFCVSEELLINRLGTRFKILNVVSGRSFTGRQSSDVRSPKKTYFRLAPTGDVISCAFDGTIRVWDPKTGDMISELEEKGKRCVFLPDARVACTFSEDIEGRTRKLVRIFPSGIYDSFSFEQKILLRALHLLELKSFQEKKKLFGKSLQSPLNIKNLPEAFEILSELPEKVIKALRFKRWIQISDQDLQEIESLKKLYAKERLVIQEVKDIFDQLLALTRKKKFSATDVEALFKEAQKTIALQLESRRAKKDVQWLFERIEQVAELATNVAFFQQAVSKKDLQEAERLLKQVEESPFTERFVIERLRKQFADAKAIFHDEEQEGESDEEY